MQSFIKYAPLLLTCISSSDVQSTESNSRVKRNVLKKGSVASNIDIQNMKRLNDEFKNLKAVTWKERDMDKKIKIPVYIRPENYNTGEFIDSDIERYSAQIEENTLKAFDLFNDTNIRFYMIGETEKDELFKNGHPHIRIRYEFPWLDIADPMINRCQVNHIGALFPQVDITLGCLFKFGSDSYQKPGTIAHEFMHALGFIHEHNRPDSGDWLDHQKSFDELYAFPTSEIIMHTPYDIGSIMHYPSPSLKLKSQFSVAEIYQGQRDKLSKLDILEVNDAYPLDFFRVEHDEFSDDSGSGESRNEKFKIIIDGSCEYRGFTKNSKPNGYGRTVCKHQNLDSSKEYLDVYFGDYLEGERHGKGTQIYLDGTQAEGLWKQDEYVVGSGYKGEINTGITYTTPETISTEASTVRAMTLRATTPELTTSYVTISEDKTTFTTPVIVMACFVLWVLIVLLLKKATQKLETNKYTEFV